MTNKASFSTALLLTTSLLLVGTPSVARELEDSIMMATTVTTEYFPVNGLNFTCTVLKKKTNDKDLPGRDHKNVMLLHGFPYSRHWWSPLLEHWANQTTTTTSAASVHAVACDLRGYSPENSPDTIEAYTFDKLESDVLALADQAGFIEDGFHLLGHDHGAGLGWYTASRNPETVLSFTSIAVPHPKLMSEALCGDNVDEAQVLAYNYANQYSLVDSASANNASLTKFYKTFGLIDRDLSTDQFQKMLWWYNRSHEHLSVPRVLSDEEVLDSFFVQSQRRAIPLPERPCIPVDDDALVGSVEVPVLYVCGAQDPYVLCNNDYAVNVPPSLVPNMEHVSFQCKHNFWDTSSSEGAGDCEDVAELEAVMDAVTAFVFGEEDSGLHDDDNDTSGASVTVMATIPMMLAAFSGLVSMLAL